MGKILPFFTHITALYRSIEEGGFEVVQEGNELLGKFRLTLLENVIKRSPYKFDPLRVELPAKQPEHPFTMQKNKKGKRSRMYKNGRRRDYLNAEDLRNSFLEVEIEVLQKIRFSVRSCQ